MMLTSHGPIRLGSTTLVSATTSHQSLPYSLLLVDVTLTLAPRVSQFCAQHYGPATYNKNWIYRSDSWLYASRWEELIANRNSIDFVEVSQIFVTCRVVN